MPQNLVQYVEPCAAGNFESNQQPCLTRPIQQIIQGAPALGPMPQVLCQNNYVNSYTFIDLQSSRNHQFRQWEEIRTDGKNWKIKKDKQIVLSIWRETNK